MGHWPHSHRYLKRIAFVVYRWSRSILKSVLTDIMRCLEIHVDFIARGNGWFRTGSRLATFVIAWFVYVPIHELLHVAGCLLTGGTVTRLEVAPQYGGTLLRHVFPFVVSGGDYAGRLSGFDTHGSDWCYMWTVFLPFVLTILFGIPLLKLAAYRVNPWIVGPGLVMAMAPFYSLPGDYFEMGSVLVTRIIGSLSGSSEPAFAALRSDDVVKLIATIVTNPAELQVRGAVQFLAAAVVIVISGIMALFLSLVTYRLGERFAGLLSISGGKPAEAPATSG